jgi:hypothetical protein
MEKIDRKTLCKVCLEDFRGTTMGALVGIILSVVTWNPICLAGTLFGGFLLDATNTCDQCGGDDDLHQIVMADRDEQGWFFRETEAEPVSDSSEGPEFSIKHDVGFDMEGFGDE